LLGDPKPYAHTTSKRSPYGDGRASERIAGVVQRILHSKLAETGG
jgi:hypothetical protein